MPIVKLDPHEVVHQCEACGFERQLGYDVLEVGVVPDADGRLGEEDDRADPIVALPSCNQCGAGEMLRLPDGNSSKPNDLAVVWKRLGQAPLDPGLFDSEMHLGDLAMEEPSTDDISTY